MVYNLKIFSKHPEKEGTDKLIKATSYTASSLSDAKAPFPGFRPHKFAGHHFQWLKNLIRSVSGLQFLYINDCYFLFAPRGGTGMKNSETGIWE